MPIQLCDYGQCLIFIDEKGKNYVAGDEWLFEGPGTYIPKKEVEVIETVRASIIRPNQAIKLRARKETQVGSDTVEWLSVECRVVG